MQLSAIREAARDHLGVSANDPAYPDARLNRYINLWLNALYADLKADALTKTATLAVDNGQTHQYSLTQQSPAITDFRKALDVRIATDEGSQLKEKGISELRTVGGFHYAITGADQLAVLTTGPNVTASTALFFRYAYWPAELAADGDVPSALPDRLHWVIGLGVAEFCFTQGDEARMPPNLKDLLDDGRAQLLSHMGRRSLDVATRRS